MLKYIYKDIHSHIFINFFFVFNRNAFDAYFRKIYTAVRSNIPRNTLQNINTRFYNNNFSTAVGYVSTKMGREDIRDAKKPYATTNIYNPGANPPVLPLYTNPLQIGKLLQLQQWPNCPQVGGACHQPHILCKPDMAIVLEEIQFQPPAQAQVAGQAPPGGPGGPAQAPTGPPGGGGPTGGGGPPAGGPSTSGQGSAPAGGPSTSGQSSAQKGNNDDNDDEEPEDDDDPYAPDDDYPEDDDDNGNYECDEEEEEESTDDSQHDSDEYDDIYDDDDNDDVRAPGEYDDDNDHPNQKRKCESPHKGAKKHKTGESSMPLREHKERVETIVDVPREHEMEQIPQDKSLLSPELTTPYQSRVQDTPPRRHSPCIKDQTVTEPIPAMPLEFVHPGMENTAARIETPQNPSSERNPLISRKLVLTTPFGANPQQSTSTGGENIKTIPGKRAPKTGQHGRRVVRSGDGAPSGRGRGPAPTRGHAPVPGVVTRAAAGGGGGGAGAPVVPVRNAQYIYRSPLVIIEIEGKKVSWDHNKYASKAFCAMACGLAFAPQGYIVHVFPDKVDVISTFRDVNDMTIKSEAERINMQRDDQRLATQFDTLTDR